MPIVQGSQILDSFNWKSLDLSSVSSDLDPSNRGDGKSGWLLTILETILVAGVLYFVHLKAHSIHRSPDRASRSGQSSLFYSVFLLLVMLSAGLLMSSWYFLTSRSQEPGVVAPGSFQAVSGRDGVVDAAELKVVFDQTFKALPQRSAYHVVHDSDYTGTLNENEYGRAIFVAATHDFLYNLHPILGDCLTFMTGMEFFATACFIWMLSTVVCYSFARWFFGESGRATLKLVLLCEFSIFAVAATLDQGILQGILHASILFAWFIWTTKSRGEW